MVQYDFSFDEFNEESVEPFKIVDQYGISCWYNPKAEIVTPVNGLEDEFISFKDYLMNQDKPSEN